MAEFESERLQDEKDALEFEQKLLREEQEAEQKLKA